MKPLGIAIDTTGIRVTMPSRVEDAIWLAVSSAIEAGLSARDFRIESAKAWEYELRELAKEAVSDLTRG
jgi:hypothetical protein